MLRRIRVTRVIWLRWWHRLRRWSRFRNWRWRWWFRLGWRGYNLLGSLWGHRGYNLLGEWR